MRWIGGLGRRDIRARRVPPPDNHATSSSSVVGIEGLTPMPPPNHNYHYFGCSSCNTKSSVLSNSVLSNSNTKLREFVILMYLFCDNHRTYKTVQKETCINIEGYKDVKLSSATINKWFSYFRHLVVQDNKQYPPPMVGGIGDIVEIDESTLIDNGLKPQIIKT